MSMPTTEVSLANQNPFGKVLDTFRSLAAPPIRRQLTFDSLYARVASIPEGERELTLTTGERIILGISRQSCLEKPEDGLHMVLRRPEGTTPERGELSHHASLEVIEKSLKLIREVLGEEAHRITLGICFGAFRNINNPHWHAHIVVYVREDAKVAEQWGDPLCENQPGADLSALNTTRIAHWTKDGPNFVTFVGPSLQRCLEAVDGYPNYGGRLTMNIGPSPQRALIHTTRDRPAVSRTRRNVAKPGS